MYSIFVRVYMYSIHVCVHNKLINCVHTLCMHTASDMQGACNTVRTTSTGRRG